MEKPKDPNVSFWQEHQGGWKIEHHNQGKIAERKQQEAREQELWCNDVKALSGVYTNQNLARLWKIDDLEASKEIMGYRAVMRTALAKETLSRLMAVMVLSKDINWDSRSGAVETFFELADRTLLDGAGGLRWKEVEQALSGSNLKE